MRFFEWLKGLFAKKEARRSNPLTLQRQDTRETAKETGAYDSFQELLDDLDEKFNRLKLTKFRRYRGAVGQSNALKYLGAYIMSESSMIGVDQLEPHIRTMLPSILVTSMPMALGSDNILGDWLMIIKIKHNTSNVQWVPRSHTKYALEVTLPIHLNMPSIHTGLAYFAVKPDGTVYELRYKDDHGRWHYCPRENKESTWVQCFCAIANAAAMRDFHWSVVARKGDYKILFSIPDNDAPHFFRKHRSKEGKIFHAVRAHTRSNGSNVRTHYRGKRRFLWGGYNISIHIPGKHIKPIIESSEAL